MTVIPAGFTPFRAGRSPDAQYGSLAFPAFTGTWTLLADVSEFQPDIADAAYLAWSKAIVIRACYGGAHDDHAWYGGQRRQLLHAGGARFLGIYAYLVAGQDGGAQADALHSLVGPLQPGEVLIADFEEGQHPMLTAWYNRMLLWGYPAKYLWTYTGLNFGQANGALPVEWIAAYGAAEPSSPHTLWQFTDAFPVPGVGTADCSVFHGSIDQLAALAYQPAKLAPAPPAAHRHMVAAGNTASLDALAAARNTTAALIAQVSRQYLNPLNLAVLNAYLALDTALTAAGQPHPAMPPGMVYWTVNP